MHSITKRILLTSLICILLFSAIPQVCATTETRYMRSDQHTVNGLTAYRLDLTQSDSWIGRTLHHSASYSVPNIGIRVWKRQADGTETEITSGTPVAQATMGQTLTYYSATWDCPETSLADTDAIVVRVYGRTAGNTWSLLETFTTEQLDATQLDSATWTIYYFGDCIYNFYFGYYILHFYFGSSDRSSRIEGFSYTVGEAREWHNIDSLNFNITTKAWFNLDTLPFNILTKQWHPLSILPFNIITKTWNPLDYLFFTLKTEQIAIPTKHFPFPIIIGGILILAIAVLWLYGKL